MHDLVNVHLFVTTFAWTYFRAEPVDAKLREKSVLTTAVSTIKIQYYRPNTDHFFENTDQIQTNICQNTDLNSEKSEIEPTVYDMLHTLLV